VGKLEGKNYLEVLGINGRIILNGSAGNCLSFDSDVLSLDGNFLQALVKTTVNHWVV
jgi:hypothetical protein